MVFLVLLALPFNRGQFGCPSAQQRKFGAKRLCRCKVIADQPATKFERNKSMSSKPTWEMTEAEYIDYQTTAFLNYYASRTRRTPRQVRQQAIWKERIENRTDQWLAYCRKQYQKNLRKALRCGHQIPEAILDQAPVYRKIRDDYLAYQKGRATSFSPSGVDASLLDEYGVRVKHQDGSVVTPATLDYVRHTLANIEEMFRFHDCYDFSFRRLFDPPLTVAHTQGLHPFMRDSGGLFRPNTGDADWTPSISIGCKYVDSGAHELAHAIDWYTKRPPDVTDGQKPYARDHASDWMPDNLYCRLLDGCNNARDLDRLLALQKYADEPEDVVKAIRVAKIRGRYWRRRNEVFARAIDQLTSSFCSMIDNHDGTTPYDQIRQQHGMWNLDAAEADGLLSQVLPLVARVYPDDTDIEEN
jgi:hypothetical protein